MTNETGKPAVAAGRSTGPSRLISKKPAQAARVPSKTLARQAIRDPGPSRHPRSRRRTGALRRAEREMQQVARTSRAARSTKQLKTQARPLLGHENVPASVHHRRRKRLALPQGALRRLRYAFRFVGIPRGAGKHPRIAAASGRSTGADGITSDRRRRDPRLTRTCRSPEPITAVRVFPAEGSSQNRSLEEIP